MPLSEWSSLFKWLLLLSTFEEPQLFHWPCLLCAEPSHLKVAFITELSGRDSVAGVGKSL